jgi:superfamily II DNA or RNA helicase
MVTINVTNLVCNLKGDLKTLNRIREDFKFRHPNAYHIRQYMPRGWDGYIHVITEAGNMPTGYLPRFLEAIEKNGHPYRMIDNRNEFEPGEIPEEIRKFTMRGYQLEAIRAVVNNYIEGLYFPRGIISAATNAGKTLIMAGIYASYPKTRGLILLNDSTLYDQFLTDMPKLFGSHWGYCRGKKIKWGRITVAMVQTLVKHLNEFNEELAMVDVLLVDECDLSTSKTYKAVMKRVFNATVKVGLSGTVFIRNLAKDRVKNNSIIGNFGQELFKIKNLELMEKGFSTPVVIKIIRGNAFEPRARDYEEIYKECIVRNVRRNQMAVDRAKYYVASETFPILVACKLHEHVEIAFNLYKKTFWPKYRVDWVHGDRKDRAEVIEKFRAGEIDILVSSMIIKRGQNMPLIRVIQLLAGGDDPATPLQLLGRGTRTDDSKEKFYFEDFLDMGEYVSRHAKHRIAYYKNEGFKIIDLLQKF